MLAPWRIPVSRSLHRNRSQPHCRYFQLATVNRNNCPSNRTVVFRDFVKDTNNIKIITDLKSEKISEIENNSQAEICWYFTKTREQFRINGKIIIIKEENEEQIERYLTWNNLSDAARSQFAWPTTGALRNENKELFFPPIPDKNKPLSNFCLLILTPEKVEHLQLKGEPQNRFIYTLNKEQVWTIKEVNP